MAGTFLERLTSTLYKNAFKKSVISASDKIGNKQTLSHINYFHIAAEVYPSLS